MQTQVHGRDEAEDRNGVGEWHRLLKSEFIVFINFRCVFFTCHISLHAELGSRCGELPAPAKRWVGGQAT